MYDRKLRIVVTYIRDNVATREFEVNSVNKNIVNKCGRIIVNSCRLADYWIKGVTLHEQHIRKSPHGLLQYSPKIMHAQELLFAAVRRSSSCG